MNTELSNQSGIFLTSMPDASGRLLANSRSYPGRVMFELVLCLASLFSPGLGCNTTPLPSVPPPQYPPLPPQNDLCAEMGWYGDGVCDDFCPLEDVLDCQVGGSSGDICAEMGWYGDGVCDDFCPLVDVLDCQTGGGSGDICAEMGWYGDGICDDFCPLFDPDCF